MIATTKFRLMRLLMASGSIAAASAAWVPAVAQAQVKAFDIPAQALSSALGQFSSQSDVLLVVAPELTEGKTSPGVKATLSNDQAITRILQGTGLHAVPNARGGYRIENGEATSSGETGAGSAAATYESAEIIVTGSRIAQPQYSSPSPVAVTNLTQIERSGLSSALGVLELMPQFSAGTNSQTAGVISGEAGANFANLRGLGENRTLVLVNGQRRVSGAATQSAVDLSGIPANMIQRAEVVTGGAAAVYGADAVSGVVNILLRNDVDGFELSTRQGLSSRGDSYSYSYGGLFGGAVGDRGRFTIGVSYNHDSPLYWRERGWSAEQEAVFPNPANLTGSDGIFDNLLYRGAVFPGAPYSGAFTIGGTRYTYDGAVRPTQNEVLFGPNSFAAVHGDGANVADFNALRTGSSVISSLAHFDYELTDSIKFSSDLQFAQTHGFVSGQPLLTFTTLQRDNPLIPADVAALMDQNGMTTLDIARDDRDQGRAMRDITRTTYTGVARLEGKIVPSVSWQVFAQYGRYDSRDIVKNDRIVSRYNEALDAISSPSGPICRSATARAAGCRPLSLFGFNAATPEALAYFHHDIVTNTTNDQFVAGGQLTGSLFELPAGSVSFASGVEYRKESLSSRPDGLSSTGQTFSTRGGPIDAMFNVKEVFGEITVPFLKEMPLAKQLDFNGAVRFSDYSTIGSTTTWKLGLVYAPIEDIKFRVTRSRSVRAPNLFELFSAGSSGLVGITDPCDAPQIGSNPNRQANCAALGLPNGFIDPLANIVRVVSTGGNPALKQETSDSFTAGIILQPSFLRGFRASIDYFDVKIKGAIFTLGVQDIVNKCVDGPTLESALCDIITRRSDGGISVVSVTPINIGSLNVRGIDFSADYSTSAGILLGNPLRLGVSLTGSYYLKNNVLVNASEPENTLHLAGSLGQANGVPRFRGTLATTANLGKANLTWSLRYISSGKLQKDVSDEFRSDNNVRAIAYNDLYASYQFTDRFQLGVGVNNLLDVKPRSQAGLYYYDFAGTSFFLTAGLKL